MSFENDVVLFHKEYYSVVCGDTAMFHIYSVALGQMEKGSSGNLN